MPVSVIFCGLFKALSVIVRRAERDPVAVGLNVTVRLQLAPAARVPLVHPFLVKSPEFVPPRTMLVRFNAVVPLLLSTTVLLEVLFTL